MGITRDLLLNLIHDKELIISPYDQQYLVGNMYEMHNNGYISYYEEAYGSTLAIDTQNPLKLKTDKIPKNGFCLEPNRIYYLTLKERVTCPRYTTTISTHRELSQYGLTLSTKDSPQYGSESQFDVSLTASQPLLIYPEQKIASLSIDAGDAGTSAVPIGGIIAWRGGPLPYGYCYCDGSNGSPNLMNELIMGSNVNQYQPPFLNGGLAVGAMKLIFIMRYK